MHIYLGVEGALVVEHIAYVWDIETSSGYISADKDCCFGRFLLFSCSSKLNWLVLDLLHG